MINFLDTSAILNGAFKYCTNIYISPLAVKELENIKNGNRNDHIKYLARQAVRDILSYPEVYKIYYAPTRKVERIIKKSKILMNIPDHILLSEAIILQEETKEQVNFITSDGSLYLYAQAMPRLVAEYIKEKKEHVEDYCGWEDFYPTEEQFINLYSKPQENVLGAKANEFCKIYENTILKDILFWNGERYENLKFKNIRNQYTGETIKPRNIEQKMAMHLLQDSNIKVKLLMSAWGGGKTLLALNYALEQISRGYFDKLVFIRNNIIAANTNDIGFIPGNVSEKLSIWSRCLADHVGGEMELDQLIESGLIETVPLSHIRGRSLKNSIVLVDECENMDDKLITLVMSRIEESSEIIFCGDIAQIDRKAFEEHNGIESMIKNLVGDPLFGMVKLVKSERGPVPLLCDKMIPPK